MAEYYVKRILERNGYGYIIRSFASLTPIDLIASNGTDIIAVQVKVGGYLSREAKILLVEWASKFHAKAFLARKYRGRWAIVPIVLGAANQAVSVSSPSAPSLPSPANITDAAAAVAPQSSASHSAA